MKVYWVNVYDDYGYGYCLDSKDLAEQTSASIYRLFKSKTIYRIKVTMKA